jgi:rhamnose utilization protein RhaD (predicted bifunctional aldolase and dehydrogenase)
MIADDPEFRALRHYAAEIGADPALVQAAGGNVSLKRGGVLWVKASGTWLANAERADIFVPVRLEPLLAAMHADAAEDTSPFVLTALNRSGLRPSIETTLHGVLPHPVVVHVHCVETMAWAARADAPTVLAPLLAGLRWVFVPYVRPGAPLTRAILDVLVPGTDVIVLGNHGLVVGGADTAAAAALVAEVAGRLRRPARPAPPPDLSALAALAEGTAYRPADDPAAHGTATDPLALGVAGVGSLYPDHVIFLGPGIVTRPPGVENTPMLVVPGAGVLVHRGASSGVAPLARCLADVCARLDPSEPIVALTAAQEGELLGWDAEKYRQALNATPAAR